jgi:hypothetical protein
MGDSPSRLERFNDTVRAALFNFKMVFALAVFVPVDALMLQTQLPLLRDFYPGLAAWFALLASAALGFGRLAARGGELGDVFAGEVSCILGLFLVLLYSVGDGTRKVGRAWDIGFLCAGLALGAFGVVRLVRLIRSARVAETELP